MKIISRTAVSCMALLPVACAQAAADRFLLNLSASTLYTDNALKQYQDSSSGLPDLIAEQQNILSLGLNGNYANEWVSLLAGYNASDIQYSEKSQPSYSSVEGRSDIRFGNATFPASLLVSHARMTVLNAPDAIDISTNLDDRDTLVVEPAYRFRITAADALRMSYRYSDVSYRKNEFKNLTTDGGELRWIHNISKVDTFEVGAVSTSSSYDNMTGKDYQLQTLSAKYAVALSHLKYAAEVGSTRSKSDELNKSSTQPNYNLSATYETGLNSLRVSLDKRITNASEGIDNRNTLVKPVVPSVVNGAVNPKETSLNGFDLINASALEIAVTTRWVCDLCDVSLSLSSKKDDYQTLPEDKKVKSANLGFMYHLSRAASVELDYLRSDTSFLNAAARINFTLDSAKLAFNYRFFNQMTLKVYAGEEKRDSVVLSQSFKEKIAGMSLAYQY